MFLWSACHFSTEFTVTPTALAIDVLPQPFVFNSDMSDCASVIWPHSTILGTVLSIGFRKIFSDIFSDFTPKGIDNSILSMVL